METRSIEMLVVDITRLLTEIEEEVLTEDDGYGIIEASDQGWEEIAPEDNNVTEILAALQVIDNKLQTILELNEGQ